MYKIKKVFAISLMAVVMVFFTGCDGNTQEFVNNVIDTTKSVTDKDNNLDIYMYAKEAIKQQLDCPSTAVFPSYTKAVINRRMDTEDPEYYVKSYVDADNLAGAKVRLYFEVIIYNTNSGYEYDLISLE